MNENQHELTDRVAAGDQAALAQLFGLYRPKLLRMIGFRMDRRIQGRVDPSDVLQEAFLALAERVQEFSASPDRSFFAWARFVTYEKLMKFHRYHLETHKRDARREHSIQRFSAGNETSFSIAAALLADTSSISQKASLAEQQEALLGVLADMEELDREIIALRIFEGMSNGEAAQTLQLTKQTTSKRFLRALKHLRQKVKQAPALYELLRHE